MAKTVIAIYDDIAAAYGAVKELMDHGFPGESISILINENDTTHEEAGVFLNEVKQLVVPGIGSVSAAGVIARTLMEKENHGILETLEDLGLPEETSNSFAEGVRQGGTLVSTQSADSAAEEARDLLELHQPYDVNQRLKHWRQEGWQRFDPEAKPLTPGELHAEPSYTDWTPIPSDDVLITYSDFNMYETDFRNHFATTMIGSGYTYEQYQPAYRYGYNLALNHRNHERGWREVEPEAKQYWDQRSPGAWDHIKSAVRYAWDEIRDSVR